MAIRIQGRFVNSGKTFWTSGGGAFQPPTDTESFAIALEDGTGLFFVEDDAGYVAQEDAPANGGGTAPDPDPTPTPGDTIPSNAVLAQDGSTIMAQNGTDYISF